MRGLQGPSMLVVAADGAIESMTPDAEAAIADLQTTGSTANITRRPSSPPPAGPRTVASSARVALRARGRRGRGSSSTRPPSVTTVEWR
jgi:hypothetical protein